MKIARMFVALGLIQLSAQEIKLPANLEKLSAKAEESVEVTLDSNMLRLISRFDKDADALAAKRLIAGLDNLYVRSFKFASEGEYNMADVETVRSQFQGAPWSRIVGVRSKRSGGDVDVYFKDGGNGKLSGVVVIAAEPTELTFVSIVGSIQPEQLADLGGQFHIPSLDMSLRGTRRRDMR
jgi:hypothetical protein